MGTLHRPFSQQESCHKTVPTLFSIIPDDYGSSFKCLGLKICVMAGECVRLLTLGNPTLSMADHSISLSVSEGIKPVG